MEKETGKIYLEFDYGEDIAGTLRSVADEIVNGRIVCNGIEQREEDGEMETYWVKDCGAYEILVPMPINAKEPLVYDVHGRQLLSIQVRRKSSER